MGFITFFLFNFFLYVRLLRLIPVSMLYYLLDICVCVLGAIVFFDFIRRPRCGREHILVILTILLSVVGVLSTMRSRLDLNLISVLMDAYTYWRYVIILFIGIWCGNKIQSSYDRVKVALIWSARLATIVYLGLAVVCFMKHISWNPMRGYLGEIVMSLCILLISDKWYDIFFSLMACVSIISMGSMIAIGTVGVFTVIFLYKWLLKIQSNVIFILLSAASAVGLGYLEFTNYYLNFANPSPRQILLMDGLKLAKQYCPLGSGFASFCSQVALKNISPLYEEFGYSDTIIACTQDSFWSCILGQFGYIGIVLFFLIFCEIFFLCLKHRKNIYAFASMYFCLCYFVISSLGGNSILTTATVAFFSLGLIYSGKEYSERVEKSK